MLGEKLYEVTGKITGTRVLPCEGMGVGVETSFQGTGKLLGSDTQEIGTYKSVRRASGELYGQGQGITMSSSGESATWTGFGIGKPTGKGLAASYRYAVSYQTSSPKWSRINGVVLVGEWEIDENGNAKGQAWEWR